MQPVWVLVNCTTVQEANEIGDKVLQKRLGSCFDIFERNLASFFWPPKTGKKETATGALLIVETFEEKFDEVQSYVKSIHSDELPFIGYIEIKGTGDAYKSWMEGELK